MRKFLAILLCTIFLTGCSSELSFSEVSVERVKQDIQSFIVDVKNENGIHLYLDNQKAIYVFLNGINVKQGEKALHFTDFHVEGNGDTLNILYSKAETTNYANQSLNNELLYKVNLDKNYQNVKVFNDGEEVSFGVISGNQ